MGTKPHKPSHDKQTWQGRRNDAKPAGPGERPGVPSRLGAARERIRRRGQA